MLDILKVYLVIFDFFLIYIYILKMKSLLHSFMSFNTKKISTNTITSIRKYQQIQQPQLEGLLTWILTSNQDEYEKLFLTYDKEEF